MAMISTIRLRVAAVLPGLALTLSGCFMTPGKFTSQLHLTGPDSFTFSHDGEIFFLGLSNLAQMDAMSPDNFTPSCFDNETLESRCERTRRLAKAGGRANRRYHGRD